MTNTTQIDKQSNNWQIKKIEDIAEVVGGGTPSTKNPDNFGGEISWITPKDLSEHKDRYIGRGERSLTKQGLDNSSAKILPPNTVLLSSRAPVGYTAISANELCTNQGFRSMIPKKDISSEYLYYLTKANTHVFESNASGSTFKELSGGRLKKLSFLIAPESEQKEIAFVLSSLDDKIELNRKVNQTLEAIGKALFRQWFVDFEFPNEEGKPYKSSGGEMVDSELGEIPEGWEVVEVGRYLEILDSQRVPLSRRERAKRQGDFRYYGATGVIDHVNDYLFDGIYLLIGEDGTVVGESGRPYTQYVWGKFWANNHAHVLQGKPPFSTEYMKLFFDNIRIKPYITGAVQPKLNQGNLKSIPLLVSPKSLLSDFQKYIETLFALTRNNEEQINNLEKARDSLLPRLISGKLRV